MAKDQISDDLIQLAREGARRLLSTCLPLRKCDTGALFFDGSTRRVAALLREAASELQVTLRERYIPVREQIAFRGEFSAEDHSVLNDALAIITCLSSNPRSTTYRRELLKAGTNFDNYFGHMPGANLSVLAHALNVDFEASEARCDDLALALARTRNAVLYSYDLDKKGEPVREHRLNLSLAERRLPITSTGVIPRGTWGNIPGGEVFVEPAEGLANGVFALNGAFLNYVLPAGSSLHLIFEAGAMVRVEGKGEPLAAFNKLINWARRRGGAHFNQVAELGIGVNSGIVELSGSALLDEKCAGTAHIAIGDNMRYGGVNESSIHEDFITRRPSIDLDGHRILDFGKDVIDASHWRESVFDKGDSSFLDDPNIYLVKDRTVRADRVNGAALRVNQEVASGRICRYTMGDRQSSPILAALYHMLPDRLSAVCERARKEMELPRDIAVRGLSILLTHGLLREQSRS